MLLRVAIFSVLCVVHACDVCDGLAASKVASGQVLEISDEGLRRLAPSHNPLALLLYKPWNDKTVRMQKVFDEVATFFKRQGMPLVMAQIDVTAFPAALSALRIADAELPCVRILRGDDRFGYPLRLSGATMVAGTLADALSSEYEATYGDGGVRALPPDELAALESGVVLPGVQGTRVIGRGLTHPRSVHAFEQVAYALRGAVTFARAAPAPPVAPSSAPPPESLSQADDVTAATVAAASPVAAAATPVAAAASPEVASPAAPPVRIDATLAPSGEERILVVRERSSDMEGEAPTIEMPPPPPLDASSSPSDAYGADGTPAARGRLSAAALYSWVRWASLPTVYELTAQSASTYLTEGSSAVLFVPGASTAPKTREYARRRLRKLSERLRGAGEHGLWLLWADAYDATHSRLRAQLELPPRHATSATTTATATATATAAASASASASASAAAPGGGVGAADGEFGIVVMAGGRISERYVMPPPFSFDAAHEFALDFLHGRLRARAERRTLLRRLGVGFIALCAVFACWRWYLPWSRRRREAAAAAGGEPADFTGFGRPQKERGEAAPPKTTSGKAKAE